MVALFPAFLFCPRDRFLAVVAEICKSWTRRTGNVFVPTNPPRSRVTTPQPAETALQLGQPERRLHLGDPRWPCGDWSCSAAGEVRAHVLHSADISRAKSGATRLLTTDMSVN